MENSISKGIATCYYLKDISNYFYSVSIMKHRVTLQGKYSESLINFLKAVNVKLILDGEFYRGKGNFNEQLLEFVVEKEN